jgi:perosamine synthetase
MSRGLWRIGNKEIEYIKEAFNCGLHNSWNKRLEEEFADRFGVNYAIGVNSGTSALHCALFAAGVTEGDEVIVPPLTFGAPAFATMLLGGVPVFADIHTDTFTIDPQDIERKITNRTKAIVPVSLYGLPSDIFSIMRVAKEHNIIVVEDNAECFLGMYNGKIAGSVADISTFSFQRSKHLTSESGGMLVTNDEAIAERARKFSILGYATLKARSGEQTVTMDQVQRPDFIRHELIAPNYRLPEICAAMMVAQLENIDKFVQKRQQIADLYSSAIRGCDWLVPQKTPQDFVNSYWTYAIRLDTDKTAISWFDFRKAYLSEGGEPYYAAWMINYLEPALNGKTFPEHGLIYERGICPIAEKIQPQLKQFKTNFGSLQHARTQARVLRRTIKKFAM